MEWFIGWGIIGIVVLAGALYISIRDWVENNVYLSRFGLRVGRRVYHKLHIKKSGLLYGSLMWLWPWTRLRPDRPWLDFGCEGTFATLKDREKFWEDYSNHLK